MSKARHTSRTTGTALEDAIERDTAAPVSKKGDFVEKRSGLDRRSKAGRRRTDHRRDAEDGHMNEEQLAFILAIEEFKEVNGVTFPTWTDVLDVVLYLGYRKCAPVGEHQLSTTKADPELDVPPPAARRRSRSADDADDLQSAPEPDGEE